MASNVIEGSQVKEVQTNQTARFLLHTRVTGEVKSFVGPQESVPTKAKIRFKLESPPTFTYDVSFTPTIRGRHEMSVRVDGVEVTGSPAEVFVHRPPSQLGKSIEGRVISDPAIGMGGMAVGPEEQLYVCEYDQKVSVFNKSGDKRTFGGMGGPPFYGSNPRYLAVDDDGNMYVTTNQKELCKINKDGKLVGSPVKMWDAGVAGQGWLDDPQGVEVNNNQVYVCNSAHGGHGMVVFDTDLNFLRAFGCSGHVEGMFSSPLQDLSVDADGNIYIVDCGHNRVQVVDQYGQYLHHFGRKGDGEGELKEPRGIHVRGEYVYVSDTGNSRISVFNTSGQFITTFGKYGDEPGELRRPWGITTDSDGFLFVCDPGKHCVEVF